MNTSEQKFPADILLQDNPCEYFRQLSVYWMERTEFWMDAYAAERADHERTIMAWDEERSHAP